MPKSQLSISLPHFCHYLAQIPPSEYDSVTRLCAWSLRYTNAEGIQPFLKDALSQKNEQELRHDFSMSVQSIVVNDRNREAWARHWCQQMGFGIDNETQSMSVQRRQHVSPVYLAQQFGHYQTFVQRTEALKKMQQRKAQQSQA
jgi:hypothetical protein